MQKKTRHQPLVASHLSGFTLLELLIVITLVVIVLITATSLFFTTLLGGGKSASAEYAKQSGQNALNQMTYLIRNAKKLSTNAAGDTCEAAMDSIGLVNQDGGTSILSLYQNKIASSSGTTVTTANTAFLTPTDLVIVNGAFDFTCTPTTYGTANWDGSPPRITISFSIQKGTTGVDQARDIVTIPFQSTITMRNY
jgi:prepilin-type N-terminal cleavage/methylation domain-containing protein